MVYYLAVDLGTTGCRSIVFDEKLEALADSYKEYGLSVPEMNWAEQDASLWWELTAATAHEAIAGSGIDPEKIDSISVSSQGITIVPVDRQLTPLRPAITWLDVRAEEQAEFLNAEWGNDNCFLKTGKRIDPCYTLPKLIWLKQNEPDVFNKAWKFLMPMDFLIGKLTGNCVTDHSMASGTLLYDIKEQVWCREVLDKYGIAEERLPAIKWSGESAGCVLPEVAQLLGLRPDCTVAVGAQDQKCAALGAGLNDSTMTISLGTAGAIIKLWSSPELENHSKVGWCGNTERGTWVTEGVINTAATCLRWVRDVMFPGESYDVINREAEEAEKRGSGLMFFPFLNGPSSPNYYEGATGSFYGASLATQRGDFALAVMEGVAFQIRIMLEAMGAYGEVENLVLFGGGSKSPLWCRIIADATAMTIKVPTTSEAAAAGAAILAARAAGERLSPLDVGAEYLPDAERLKKKYERYTDIERRLWH